MQNSRGGKEEGQRLQTSGNKRGRQGVRKRREERRRQEGEK